MPLLAEQTETRVMGDCVDGLPRIGWRELLSRVRREPVVWHAHRINELIVGWALRAIGRDVRLIFTRHASTPPAPFTRFWSRRAERLVALTPEIATAMGQPSEIVSHGADLTRFHPPEDRAAAWARLGVGGRFGIGVIGRIRKEKGQGDFVEAISPLLPEHPEWRAVLVGLAKGKDEAWAAALAEKAGPNLHLAGEHAKIEPWYQGLTVLVHPSYTEGYSLVHVEALASGCCVVSSRLPYVEGLIEHGRTGFLFDPGDVKALRELLAMLMREPERALEVGRNAAELARAKLGIDHEAEALLALYRRLLAGPSR